MRETIILREPSLSDADASTVTLGIDVGGTFTDLLAVDAATGTIIDAIKLLSTPDDPSRAAVDAVDRHLADSALRASLVCHGTTVGTNTLIEKRGARAALLTTRGFRDVLALRRHARPRLYDLAPRVSRELIPRERRLEIHERIDHEGAVITPLETQALEAVLDALEAAAPEAVAIALLHAYANDDHESRLAEAVAQRLPQAFVTRSSEVCPEFREFERTSTTVVNAYIGPRVARYFAALDAALRERGIDRLAVVKSNGGLASATNASRFPVHLIESGPAAGVIATAALARAESMLDLIAFDMGGTTAKTGVVIAGEPRLTTEFYADRFEDGIDRGGYPIKSPVIDLTEIGAGGGSIAEVDAGGVIRVGPRSAGSEPGPACYGRGGVDATVTDAHVALGHIAADGFGSDDVALDRSVAQSAVANSVARPLGWSTARAAWGILRIATANMAEMVRLATLRRGLDPRDFALVAFGGAGGLHAADIAREVGIPIVLIPPLPGLFSAIGTVLGELRHDLVQTYLRPITAIDPVAVESVFASLEARARALTAAEDLATAAGWRFERSLDLRFSGQLFELILPAPEGIDPGAMEVDFRAAHRDAYGYDLPGHAVELVNCRLVARQVTWRHGWPGHPGGVHRGSGDRNRRERALLNENGTERMVEVFSRDALTPGERHRGPLVVEDFGATVRVLDGQVLVVRPSGVLAITEEESA